MNPKTGIGKVNNGIKNIGMMISCIATFGMMLLIIVDIFSRNVLSNPIAGSYEFVQSYFMPLIFFPAVAFTYNSGIMPRLQELVQKFPLAFQKFAGYLTFLLEIVLFALLTYFGFEYAMQGLADKMAFPVGGNLFPIYPVYFLIPIGFGMALLDIIINGIQSIKELHYGKN